MILLPMLAALVVIQGQAIQLEQPHEAGLEAVAVSWAGRSVPFVRDGERWTTVIGIDLGAEAGTHSAELSLRYDGGQTETRTAAIEVRTKEFPTTELTVEPRFVELSPEDSARAARERREVAAIYAELSPDAYWREPFLVPVVGVGGGRNFGHRRIFNGQPRAPHSGADLRAATGTEIRAANRGRVVLAQNLFYSGNAVFIDHGLGLYTTYLHLSETRVEPGAWVERGQTIGLAGDTGRVTGPHLHWGARILDARVDPFSLLGLGGLAGRE